MLLVFGYTEIGICANKQKAKNKQHGQKYYYSQQPFDHCETLICINYKCTVVSCRERLFAIFAIFAQKDSNNIFLSVHSLFTIKVDENLIHIKFPIYA